MPENVSFESDFESEKNNHYKFPVKGVEVDDEFFIKQAFKESPHKGFELLYNRYYKPLCSHAVRFVYSKDIAEDIIAEIFYNIWKNQVFLYINISFRSYLFTAVRNRCFLYLQQEYGKTSTLENPNMQWSETSISPDQMLFYDDLQKQIEQAIDQLPPQCQKIFLMNRFEGKKYKEIADELQVALKTVEAHINKALTHLRDVVLKNPSLFGWLAFIITLYNL
ncbi:MAG: RNA polymerase sigma-70 factor [Arcicella sp.]|jgi:RNA polymerase sigma-70 factor (ECF subfamily)|nr:RNA polymerase sigma-70 factor [Arcicella sp.]